MKEIHNNIPYGYGSQQSIGTLVQESINVTEFTVLTDIPVSATGVITLFVNGRTYSIPIHSSKPLLLLDIHYMIELDTTSGNTLSLRVRTTQSSTYINIFSIVAIVYGYGNGTLNLIAEITKDFN